MNTNDATANTPRPAYENGARALRAHRRDAEVFAGHMVLHAAPLRSVRYSYGSDWRDEILPKEKGLELFLSMRHSIADQAAISIAVSGCYAVHFYVTPGEANDIVRLCDCDCGDACKRGGEVRMLQSGVN